MRFTSVLSIDSPSRVIARPTLSGTRHRGRTAERISPRAGCRRVANASRAFQVFRGMRAPSRPAEKGRVPEKGLSGSHPLRRAFPWLPATCLMRTRMAPAKCVGSPCRSRTANVPWPSPRQCFPGRSSPISRVGPVRNPREPGLRSRPRPGWWWGCCAWLRLPVR